MIPVGQFEDEPGLVSDHPVQHTVPAELQDRQRERLDVVIRLWPGLFQFVGDVGEQHGVLAFDDGRDQLVLVAESPVDGGAADSGAAGDVVECDSAEPMLFELDDGGGEDGFCGVVSPGHSPIERTCCSAGALADDPTAS